MRPRKAPKPVTAERLEKAALAYLERFATSRDNLRRVLQRKIARARDTPEEAVPKLKAHIEALLDRFESSGLLNDAVYTEGRIAALRRRGTSARGINLKLRAKGVGKELLEEKLVDADGDDEAAAWALARRRRLGPYRSADKRADFRKKDLATFGRAGFSYDVAKRVVDGEEEPTS
jgi:regulatory protein